jgi:Single-stranded DNA-specific exonuclease
LTKGDILSAIIERDVHPLVARLLVENGINDETLLEVTFNPTVENLVTPEMMPDVENSAKLVAKVIGRKENILVWGHDDTDGISGVAVLLDALKECGGRVFYYIPHKKAAGGHTINEDGLKYAIENDVKLIITVDCCSNAVEEIEMAHSKGIEVIVTDHHEIFVKDQSYPLINPKRGGAYPYLSGSAVSFKFAWYLLKLVKHWTLDDIINEKPQYFLWTTLGIIADRVPIFSENRAIYSKAEEIFLSYTFPFTKAYENIKGKKPTFQDIINVISSSKTEGKRHEGVELLMTEDINFAEEITSRLITLSDMWFRESEAEFERILNKVSTTRPYILVDVSKRGTPYLGFLASKLKDKFKLPTIVLGRRDDGKVMGEIRAPKGFDTLHLLNHISWMLIDYGGHKLASGFSMDEAFLPSLVEELDSYFSQIGEIDYFEKSADLTVKIDEVEEKFFKDLYKMGQLGLNATVLVKGELGKISNNLLGVMVLDEYGYLGLYPQDTKVSILIQSTLDGLRVEGLRRED